VAALERHLWPGTGDFSLSRRDRQPGVYYPYIPDLLVGRAFLFYGSDTADVADAEREIASLDQATTTLVDTEALARLLLRAESVASSRIENLEVPAGRLLRADAARQMGEQSSDITANEILANIDAMEYALHAVRPNTNISVDMLLEAHKRLLAPTRIAEFGGVIRDIQNWIGKSAYSPCGADFVPPPPGLVRGYLDDLCAFCNDDSLPTVAQAAIAHAQFETIHPFVDGNGRVGRALIHMIFRRRALTTRLSPPVSLILATRSKEYISGLNATAYVGAPDSQEAVAGMNRWLATFASACRAAVAEAISLERRIQAMQSDWRTRLGSMRSDAAAIKLLRVLPGAPLISSATASKLINRSLQGTLVGVERLVEAGILKATLVGRQRGQVYEATDVVEALYTV
jgi:Fic family protein